MLPWMIGLICVATVSFIAIGLYEISHLEANIMRPTSMHTTAVLDSVKQGDFSLRAGYALEADLLDRRYHQANALLLSRCAMKYLGFLTGMLLSLVGASFVLGKLREAPSALTARGGLSHATINSSSPGLVLSALGTLLMLATIVVHDPITVNDGTFYIKSGDNTLTPKIIPKPLNSQPVAPVGPAVDVLAAEALKSLGIDAGSPFTAKQVTP